jgi:hypothetical protein
MLLAYFLAGFIIVFATQARKEVLGALKDRDLERAPGWKALLFRALVCIVCILVLLLWPIFLPSLLRGTPKKRTALDAAKEITVRAFRRIAAQRSCAPTAKTSNEKIWEIATMVGMAFRQAAEKRGEHIRAENLNFIILKFLQVYETMGERMLQEHLQYEVDRYLALGLRPDYRRELSLIGEGKHNEKPVVSVNLGGGFSGDREFSTQLFTLMLRDAIGEGYTLKLVESPYGDEFLQTAQRETFDLFVVFFNPTIEFSPSCAPEKQIGDFELLRHLKSLYRKPVVVFHNGGAGYSAEEIRQAGADAVFAMPFGAREVREGIRACLFADGDVAGLQTSDGSTALAA